MKPIETKYKGYRFRSRLEARWAVFFDVLGIRWAYEQEGYDLGRLGYYLPDFYIPGWRCYAEVKPGLFYRKDYDKCEVLEGGCILLDVPAPEWRPYYLAGHPEGSYTEYISRDEFPRVDLLQSMYEGRLFYLWGSELSVPNPGEIDPVAAARSARFEHGENGAAGQKGTGLPHRP